ncbi:MAG: DUF1294 domain-containing protein [Ruminococcaceae bacterium]|nr:DUF1294 domain-containing protein [Oscillospiraceae bacterium]
MDFIKDNLVISIFAAYIIIMSFISVIVCFWDKKISKKNRVELRIPESVLLGLSALGGSVAMLLCMLAMRHKTKHVKFMLGIPLIIILQAIAICALFYFEIFTIV